MASKVGRGKRHGQDSPGWGVSNLAHGCLVKGERAIPKKPNAASLG